MKAREEVLETVKKILLGPNPLPLFKQDNGEEILFCDSPLKTYITGILFPQTKIPEGAEDAESDNVEVETAEDIPDETLGGTVSLIGEKNIAEPSIEEETSKINNFKQSAMGLTFCLPDHVGFFEVNVSVGAYDEKAAHVPMEKKDETGERKIVFSEKERKCYYRKQINSVLHFESSTLPDKSNKHKAYDLFDSEGKLIEGLQVTVTFRLKKENTVIYTVTLVNTKHCGEEKNISQSDCWFQCGFSIKTNEKLVPLPANFCAEINDEDYQLNSLLYRDVKTYAIGHGCAAVWDDSDIPTEIMASVMPEYEVKPIVPTTSRALLSMKMYAQNKEDSLKDLRMLCDDYEEWIDREEKKANEIDDEKFKQTAKKQIELCRICLHRIDSGIRLLEENNQVWSAFSLANKAMLLQQLHYKLPLTEYKSYNIGTFSFELQNDIIMPDFDDEKTWYNASKNVYGKWRPFQIAFILMNLLSIYDKQSPERDIVDLIWFPTGGGKTEAYLGLTAFTIFMRRIKNPNDSGTAIIMRYTLRLLTAQQYERAASLICAIEKLRSENETLLGRERITIGLWVGDSLTKNKSSDVINKIKEIQTGKTNENVSVILKCPWCGASMETFKTEKTAQTPGYEISPDKKHVVFRCGNENCDFSDEDFPLPLNLFDDEIYENPPTLLFGTVDKFAMLPYVPKAKSLFGGDEERTPPELVIQDELHLITGPLGSSVGLYETLVHELCVRNGAKPKVIASTATISHAKQQCNALYGCGEENVFQFPVQGTTYKDCFFAEEKNQIGRKYVGLYGAAASSSATASIYTFAAFLYAAKAVVLDDESQRDAYWTNLAYFGSMRELGQAATWFIADIKEHLEVIYRNRLEASLEPEKRRYIYESGLAELTSRMSNEDIPKILKRLEVKCDDLEKRALDVCLATNMISVGVDISRLGLMTVTGQPKSMSEYIQATSRVGRDKSAPGLVFVIYNTSKSRDKSHYEKFQSQHSKLYFNVEPTSVTPFSRPLRERALHAVFVALHRFFVDTADRDNARRFPTEEEFKKIVDIIVERVEGIDKTETQDIKQQLYEKWEEWKAWTPEKFYSFTIGENAPLLCPAGTIKPKEWGIRGWETPTSMRNVDRECGLTCDKVLNIQGDNKNVE